jgi:hypothetical protein
MHGGLVYVPFFVLLSRVLDLRRKAVGKAPISSNGAAISARNVPFQPFRQAALPAGLTLRFGDNIMLQNHSVVRLGSSPLASKWGRRDLPRVLGPIFTRSGRGRLSPKGNSCR